MDPWVREAAAEIGKRAVRELEALVGVSSPSGDIHGAEECAAVCAALVLALYALTAVVDGEPATVSVVLCGAVAVAIWAWWDPAPVAFAVALSAAVLGPLAEIMLVELGAASYADDALFGVAPWLPCLYFGAGAVASGLWAALDGSRLSPLRRRTSTIS